MEKINFNIDVFPIVEKIFAHHGIVVVNLGHIAHSYWIKVNSRVSGILVLNRIYQECNLKFHVAAWDLDSIVLCFDEEGIC